LSYLLELHLRLRALHFLLDNMTQIVNASYATQFDSRYILEPSDPDHDDVVLLKVVTLAGNVGDGFFSARQPNLESNKNLF